MTPWYRPHVDVRVTGGCYSQFRGHSMLVVGVHFDVARRGYGDLCVRLARRRV